MRIIFAGTIGQSCLGGQAWAVLQYLLGLRALGHDVYYLEDCGHGSVVFIWEEEKWTRELDYPAAYVNDCLAPFGFADRWMYRDQERSLGMALSRLVELCASADLLILRAVPFWHWREEYNLPKRRAFIDVDPGFTQFTIANGDAGWAQGVARAERRFTVGQRIGSPDCPVPVEAGPWLKTLPPVFLPEWPLGNSDAQKLTSVMRWQGFREVVYQGVAYGLRNQEFPQFLGLPAATKAKFCIAQMGADPAMLSSYGWETVPGEIVSRTPAMYREFIQTSRAELSIPKHGYVKTRSGWFSDRSVCYLASGRPVLVEDTGFEDWLPVGQGIVTFKDFASAVAGVRSINADYQSHRRAARDLAETVFSTEKVLPALLDAAMN